MSECLYVCLYIICMSGGQEGQKKASDPPPEIGVTRQLWVALWVLGT